MRSIRKVKVSKLLGQYDHELDFPKDASFVVLHGPNGVGKTKFLELIQAVLSGNFAHIVNMPVGSFECTFDDGGILEIVKLQSDVPLEMAEERGSGEVESKPPFIVTLTQSGVCSEWAPETLDFIQIPLSRLRRIAEIELGARPINVDFWRLPSGEIITQSELYARLSAPVRVGRPYFTTTVKTPSWLDEVIADTRVHLIETQRLDKLSRRPRVSPDERQRRSTVSEFADDLSARISDALAVNSRRSQQLDRSFPRRMMTDPLPNVTDDEIRDLYQEQTKTREALEDVSILDDEEDLALPDRDLLPWERKVLWIYLQDMQMKLETFNRILDRTRLLREIVNSRFLAKEMMIDRERGFYFQSELGYEIAPEQLSSGEQHELVLMYDLLFNVEEDTLVLIDEPEISLHITWQQRFLADIERIATLAQLKFVIATHSPQIVHKWWHRTVQLGPEDTGEIEEEAEGR